MLFYDTKYVALNFGNMCTRYRGGKHLSQFTLELCGFEVLKTYDAYTVKKKYRNFKGINSSFLMNLFVQLNSTWNF